MMARLKFASRFEGRLSPAGFYRATQALGFASFAIVGASWIVIFLVSFIWPGQAIVFTVVGAVGSLALTFLCLLPFNIALGVRRLHDQGRNGWWVLPSLLVIPGIILFWFYMIAGVVLLAISTAASFGILVVPGSRGANRFGDAPPPEKVSWPIPFRTPKADLNQQLVTARSELDSAKAKLKP